MCNLQDSSDGAFSRNVLSLATRRILNVLKNSKNRKSSHQSILVNQTEFWTPSDIVFSLCSQVDYSASEHLEEEESLSEFDPPLNGHDIWTIYKRSPHEKANRLLNVLADSPVLSFSHLRKVVFNEDAELADGFTPQQITAARRPSKDFLAGHVDTIDQLMWQMKKSTGRVLARGSQKDKKIWRIAPAQTFPCGDVRWSTNEKKNLMDGLDKLIIH